MTDDGPHFIFDDLFQGCALAAFLDQASIQGSWPDAELTRRLAYHYYERALAQQTEAPTLTSAELA